MEFATLENEKANVSSLLETVDTPCISLYMPLEREPDKSQKNRIMFKNALKDLEAQLRNRNFSDKHIEQFLDAFNSDGVDEAMHGQSGIALFIAEDIIETYPLPEGVVTDTHIMIDDRFFIKPLLPLLVENGRFYILALSQNDVALYRADRDGIEDVTPDDIPKSVDDALAYEDPEKRQQYHTSTDSTLGPGGQPAAFHSHHPEEEKKDRIRRFFQELDTALTRIPQLKKNAPLILVGVDYLLPIFRQVCNNLNVLDEEIEGNPNNYAIHQLHEQAWPFAQRYFLSGRQNAAAQYNNLKGTNQTSHDLADIVAAARYGRVDTIFVSPDHTRWGTLDEETGEVDITDTPGSGVELTNYAVQQTLLNSGKAYLFSGSEMPEMNAPAAAIFRY